jgi:hypothetical protein
METKMRYLNSRKSTALSAIFVLFLAMIAGSALADSGKWIHVRINDGGDEEVSINLPLSLLSAAVRLIPNDVDAEAEIALDDLNMTWSELRSFWEEIKDAPEATYMTVRDGDDTIEVKKRGNYLVVNSAEGSGTDVDVKFPLMVVDALLSGPNNTLDFEAALNALADFGDGNLVSIRDGSDVVRVWIDDDAESGR